MNYRSREALFWYAVAAQVAGAQLFLWDALPGYRRLTAGETGVGTPKAFALAITAVVLMQSGYWLAYRARPRLQLRRRVVLGHFVLCLGEVSFFFINALASLVLLDLATKLQFVLWKFMVLIASIFSFFCYKCQLERLGEAMLGSPGEDTAGRR